MAKLHLLPLLVLLSLTLTSYALAHNPTTAIKDVDPKDFIVKGRVYCDTCRTGFETDLTAYMLGAKVRLECKRYGTGELTYQAEAITDMMGWYEVIVPDDHSEDQCSVVLVRSSTIGSCMEVEPGRDRDRVVLSQDGGLVSNVRNANPLGFLIDKPLPECGQLLQKYDFGNGDD